ncbi:hypothetical protein Mapa_013060 [Marchantia paleacea]|nr:hypothetical protein Mapa_013060 [Marchantia paleacea]
MHTFPTYQNPPFQTAVKGNINKRTTHTRTPAQNERMSGRRQELVSLDRGIKDETSISAPTVESKLA